MPASYNIIQAKQQIRDETRRLRRALTDKDALSRKISAVLCKLPEYVDAKTAMFYIESGSEVRTRPLVEEALRNGRRVVVPYCDGNDLGLFRLEDLAELAPGAHGIEEPMPRLRDVPEKIVDPAEIDLAVVPGVAFDLQGQRIGQGKGYYDRFLLTLASRAKTISPAYQCQIFQSIPTESYDVPVDMVVTEDSVYRRDD
ncbi:MAG: 5-formyltetrahydrofolate cyclo-ligase [Planctomycetota bacterium]|nr:5-formyltetrahydrofolate cyclo-ligase [Planctomycetota bacterium]